MYGKPVLHIFPFRFASVQDLAAEASDAVSREDNLDALGQDELLEFWGELRQEYQRFENERVP